MYADSSETDEEKDKSSGNAMKLYEYLNNNREGLLPYKKRGIKLPEAPKGIIYKNMGVQESQNSFEDVLSAAKVQENVGKGSRYLREIRCHMPLLDTAMTVSKIKMEI